MPHAEEIAHGRFHTGEGVPVEIDAQDEAAQQRGVDFRIRVPVLPEPAGEGEPEPGDHAGFLGLHQRQPLMRLDPQSLLACVGAKGGQLPGNSRPQLINGYVAFHSKVLPKVFKPARFPVDLL